MSILGWNPSDEMMPFPDAMNRPFEYSFHWPQSRTVPLISAETFPLDIYTDGCVLVVKATLPGIKTDGLDIEVRESVLTISGETKQEKERNEEDYHLHERRSGHIQRSVALPYAIKVDLAEAKYEDGILTLTLPRAESSKGKKILLKRRKKRKNNWWTLTE